MGREIERKFRVRAEDTSWHAESRRCLRIVQGYVVAEADRSVRVRIEDVAGDEGDEEASEATLTLKSGSKGAERSEWEYPIPVEEARSLLAEAWQLGPASPRGQELLQRARETLAGFLRELADAGQEDQVDWTVLVVSWVELARLGVVSRDPELAQEATLRATTLAQGGRLHGGRVAPDQSLGAALASLDEPEARARIPSEAPLPPSGFAPVTQAEVDAFTSDVGEGWEDWPAGSGLDSARWEELWEDDLARAEGAATGDVDRTGDGIPDGDALPGGPDADGDGVLDELPLDEAAAGCLARDCADLEGAALQACLDACAAEAEAAVAPPAAATDPADAGDPGGRAVQLPAGQAYVVQILQHQNPYPSWIDIVAESGERSTVQVSPGASASLGPFPSDRQVRVTSSFQHPNGSVLAHQLRDAGGGRVEAETGGDSDWNDVVFRVSLR